MFGYSMIGTKTGYKTVYFDLDNMLENDIIKLMNKLEGHGYLVELIKD
jgi:hypothetical protein